MLSALIWVVVSLARSAVSIAATWVEVNTPTCAEVRPATLAVVSAAIWAVLKEEIWLVVSAPTCVLDIHPIWVFNPVKLS
ncbi:hypothetical protein D3C78_923450 [compost metagenome]